MRTYRAIIFVIFPESRNHADSICHLSGSLKASSQSSQADLHPVVWFVAEFGGVRTQACFTLVVVGLL